MAGGGLDEVVVTVRRLSTLLLVVALVVLVVSGVHLAFGYRPSHSPWDGSRLGGAEVDRIERSRQLHGWSAVASLVFGTVQLVAAGAEQLVRRVRDRRALARPILAVTGLLALVAGWATGGLLAWDQVALRAITGGSDLRGYRFLFDDSSMFAFVDGDEVSIPQLRTWFLVHAGAVPLVMALAALGWWWTGRPPRRRQGDSATDVAVVAEIVSR